MATLIGIAFGALLSLEGLRKRSLSPSGAIAAFLVGSLIMSVRFRVFGASLIVFYLVGSKVTKYGKSIKASLEDGHDHSGGGYRNADQVLCNSLTAAAAAMYWSANFAAQTTQGSIARDVLTFLHISVASKEYEPDQWCSLIEPNSRFAVLIALGHFACCLGDTMASELGILSKAWPISVITLRKVPPGTNGAMSFMGTLASLCGGAIIGLTALISGLVESSTCRNEWTSSLALVGIGAFAGGLGSLLDSVLGATLQQTSYSKERKKILVEGSKDGDIISGYPVLTNSQVNLLSSLLTSFIVAYLF